MALPAGDELNAAVARLQGWKWGTVSREIPPTPGLEVWRTGEGKDFTVHAYIEAYLPSQDIVWAWPLLAEMLAAGQGVSFSVAVDVGLYVHSWTVRNNYIAEVPSLADAPLGICRVWATWKKAQP